MTDDSDPSPTKAPGEQTSAALDALEREGAGNLEKMAKSDARAARRRAAPQRPPTPKSPAERAAQAIWDQSWVGFGLLLGVAVGPLVVGGAIAVFTVHTGAAWGVGVVGLVLGALAYLALNDRLAAALLRRERAQVAALPFEVRGWYTALEAEPESGRLLVSLHFVGAAPDRSTWADLVAAVDGRVVGGSPALESPEIDVSAGLDDPVPSGGAYLRWQRRLLAQLLLPLHQAYPIASVSLRKR